MELKSIRVFVQTAKYLNFSRVAETLFLSQSSVSKYISALEDEIGQKLLVRDTKSVKLTDYGMRFLPYAERMLQEEERALQFIHQKRAHEREQTLVLGINAELQISPPNLLLFHVIRSIKEFRTQEPDCEVQLRFCPADEIQKGLQDSSLDLALVDINTNRVGKTIYPHTEFIELDYSPNYLLYSSERDEYDSFEDFVSQVDTLIYASDPTPLSLTFDFMQKTMTHPALRPCDNWVDLFIQVLEGSGCGIVPEQLVPLAEECGLNYFSLKPLDLASSVCAVWREGEKNGCLETLLKTLIQHFTTQKAQ